MIGIILVVIILTLNGKIGVCSNVGGVQVLPPTETGSQVSDETKDFSPLWLHRPSPHSFITKPCNKSSKQKAESRKQKADNENARRFCVKPVDDRTLAALVLPR